MAEEFADFMEKLKQESVEEQLSKLKSVISVLINQLERFIDNLTMELNTIHNKITKLETKQINAKLPKIEVLSTQQQQPIVNENLRSSVLGELKNLFKINGGEKN